MTGWVGEPQVQSLPRVTGLAVAGIGRRLGAWVIDDIVVFFGIGLGLVILVFASKTVAFDSNVLDQAQSGPPPNAPMLLVNQTALAAAACLFVILMAAYHAGCWAAYRGTLGQRLMSLDVVDSISRRNLPWWRALVRWLLVEGFVGIALTAAVVLFAQALATVPFWRTGFADSGLYAPAAIDPRLDSVNGLFGLVLSASVVWSIVLLISAGVQAHRRGIHDLLARSVVVGNAPAIAPTWPAYPHWSGGIPGPAATGWGNAPGYPQANYQGYPAYAGQGFGGYRQVPSPSGAPTETAPPEPPPAGADAGRGAARGAAGEAS